MMRARLRFRSHLRADEPGAKGKAVSEHSPADQQILAILETLQKAAGNANLEAGEFDKVRAILRHGETLVKIAGYEEAKGLFWAHWRGLILGAGAAFSVLVLFWNSLGRFLKAAARALQ